MVAAAAMPMRAGGADPLRPGGGFVHGNGVVSTSDLRWLPQGVPESWSTSGTLLSIFGLVAVLAMVGAWIGSRRPTVGAPVGFVGGAFASLAIVLLLAVALGI